MSAFGAKRKPRKITVQEDDDEDSPLGLGLGLGGAQDQPEPQQGPALQATFKTRRPFKQSSLRRSINVNDDRGDDDGKDEDEAGVVVKPKPKPKHTSTSASTKTKKRASAAAASRLSFGPDDSGGGGGDDGIRDDNGAGEDGGDGDSLMLGGEQVVVSTPRKKTGSLRAAAESNSAYKKGIPRNLLPGLGGLLPLRSTDADRSYSKEHLSELQSSTPNTPRPVRSTGGRGEGEGVDDDGSGEMSLDPSEIEGAMVVDESEVSTAVAPPPLPQQTEILTEAQVREKKERRARLAKQADSGAGDDYIALSDGDDDNNSKQISDRRQAGDSYLSVLSRQSGNGGSRGEGTRLVREDEDLGEGFDEFVEDGGLSLGRRAEREARRRQRAQMASLIDEAEGRDPSASLSVAGAGEAAGTAPSDGGEESDASEAERRAAYEAAQTRRGMDGLAAEREAQRKRLGSGSGHHEGVVPVPHRIAALPDLEVLAADFAARLSRRRDDAARAAAALAALRAERDEVARREPEVQRLLDEAGERYRRLVLGDAPGGGGEQQAANANVDAGAGDDAPANGEGGGGDAAAERARSLLDRARAAGGSGGSVPGTPLGMDRGLESLGTTPVRLAPAGDEV